MDIGKQILKIRKANKLNQAEFAERIGLSPKDKGRVIGHLESGITNPSFKTLEKICKEFNKQLIIKLVDKK